MFTSFQERKGQCARKIGAPLLVSETSEVVADATSQEDFTGAESSKVFLPRWKKRRGRYFTNGFDDSSILVELAWASRDPAARNCPSSRREVRARLGLNSDGSRGGSDAARRSEGASAGAAQKQQSGSRPTITVAGIGEMPGSDESGGEVLDVNTSSEMSSAASGSEDEGPGIGSGLCQGPCAGGAEYGCEDGSASRCIQEGFETPCPRPRGGLSLGADEDYAPASLKSVISSKWPYADGVGGYDQDAGTPKKPPKSSADLSMDISHYPDQMSLVNSRLGNTTYMIRNPSIMAPTLLHYLIPLTLATHQFRDAVYLMALYLTTFPRSTHLWINVNDYRLLQRFFVAAPDTHYCSMRLKLLEECYGNPTFLRHDILYDVSSLYCARREPQKALTFLERIPRVAGQSLTGTLHACLAFALYAKWLKDYTPSRKDSRRYKAELERVAVTLGHSRSTEEIRRQLEAGVLGTWKNHKILPLLFLRLLALCYASKDVDKMLSILQDFLGVCPTAPDLLELRMLFLQLRCRTWDINDYIAATVHGNDDLERLIQATLSYIDFSRGEPASLTLALQSFKDFPLLDRLRCVFLFLHSNPFYAPAWRVLVDETLGVLGSILQHSLSRDDPGPTALDHSLALWALVDRTLGPTEKLHWHRRMFDAKRTVLSGLPVGTRIFVLLLAPFFVSSWSDIVDLAQLVSAGFRGRRPPLVVPRRRYSSSALRFTVPNAAQESDGASGVSPTTIQVLHAFSRLVGCVTQSIPENPTAEQGYSQATTAADNLVLNTVELELLTEAAFYLVPRPTINNTTHLAYQQKQKCL